MEARRADPALKDATRARLSRSVLLYCVGVVLVVTLAPFDFAVPKHPRVWVTLFFFDRFDFAANVALFLPLGFLHPMAFPGRRGVARALALGCALSGMIETTQLFEADRWSSLMDVAANGGGAALGALLQGRLGARLRGSERLVGRLSLELPLMGLVYLLVPLLWASALAVRDEPLRLLPTTALGLAGARLIATFQRHHFGPAGVTSPRQAAVIGAAWMLVGTFPLYGAHPGAAAAMACAVAAAVAAEARRPRGEPGNRRFEALGLRRAAPWLAAYGALSVGVPLLHAAGPWRFTLGFTRLPESLLISEQLRLLESVAAMTVLGYMLAEARGRLELSFAASARGLAAGCALAAMMLETARGFQPAWSASHAQAALLCGAGLLGGWVYHAQRDHVRVLLGAPATPAAPAAVPERPAVAARVAAGAGNT
jgi:hypothetical protein